MQYIRGIPVGTLLLGLTLSGLLPSSPPSVAAAVAQSYTASAQPVTICPD
jgi:hypothetical protein